MPLFSRHNSPARANAPASARLAAPATRHMPVAPPAPGAMASTLLKRYRPLETRATGGFGSVEVCMDTRLQRRVAIKRIPLASPLSITPESTRAAALAEARTASMLQHPNIVSVIDFSYDAEYAYLVMEYIDGMSLEEFLAAVEGSSLTYDECAAIADALVQALAFAHENGVLHLDIKPGNVLIDHNGHVKLTDFGMATLTSAAGFGGARGGTIGYMAPEQLRGEVVDERSDIFSLAAVLYESLCATAPFRAGTPADSLKRIEKGVIYPSSLLADIPRNTEEALLAALDPDPAQRPASVQELGDWLLPGLGSSREGKKSLARIIAQLTSDEAADAEDAESVRERRVWELDPAEGYLGSRTPRARAAVSGVASGLSVAASTASILAAMRLEPGAIAAAAVAMGIAGGIAPQIGSALIAAGFITMVLNATNLIAALPVVIPVSALFIGWWYVWGRTYAPASTALSTCLALGAATGDPLVLAGVAAALAGYFLPPVPAAAACSLRLGVRSKPEPPGSVPGRKFLPDSQPASCNLSQAPPQAVGGRKYLLHSLPGRQIPFRPHQPGILIHQLWPSLMQHLYQKIHRSQQILRLEPAHHAGKPVLLGKKPKRLRAGNHRHMARTQKAVYPTSICPRVLRPFRLPRCCAG